MHTTLSVIMPVWNERQAIRAVVSEWRATPLSRHAMLFIVDDGSTDDTAQVALRQAGDAHLIRVIRLPHAGKDAAVWHAMRAVASEWIAVIDGDGQYDPHDIERLMQHAATAHADAVWGVRMVRHDTFMRRVASGVGRCVKRLVLGRCVVSDPGCGLFLLRRWGAALAVQSIPAPCGQVHCHMAEIIATCGGTVAQLPITHRRRGAGCAKYGIVNRIIPGWHSLWQAHSVIVRLRRPQPGWTR